MKQNALRKPTVISSPSAVIVEKYAPGFTIDFRQRASTTDLENLRRCFDLGEIGCSGSDADVALRVGRALVELGVAENAEDFSASLNAFTGERQLGLQLAESLRRLGVSEPPADLSQSITLLLKRTKCLDKNPHHALRVYCHIPGSQTRLEADSTHYGYILEGECVSREANRTVPLRANNFFCVAGSGTIEGNGKCVLFTRFQNVGITLYGGEVEEWGRLQYIDGCTDTLLVAPLKQGDPCYNALYYLPSTRQGQHVHPSVRCGVITSGQGTFKTPLRDYPLDKGSIFFVPPETYHSLHTFDGPCANRSALTAVAFHPDSDFGPTDTNHPMVNRTYFKFLHRLKSTSQGLPLQEEPAHDEAEMKRKEWRKK